MLLTTKLMFYFRYVGAGGLIALLSELILTIYVLVVTGFDIYKIVKQKKQ